MKINRLAYAITLLECDREHPEFKRIFGINIIYLTNIKNNKLCK